MDSKDQVAIHEAMEQQTISITKAGIQANLNARTAILAAANPRHGRYDRTKTLKANVDMTAPIMSRFDLFFVVVDDCDHLIDRNVATHIVDAHRGLKTALDAPFSKKDLQIYVKHAKRIVPKITDDAKHRLVKCYRNLRQNDVVGRSKTAYRITVRQLESLIRLAEAHARLHLCDKVEPFNVDEAARLLRKSIISVETEAVVLDDLDDEEDENEDLLAPPIYQTTIVEEDNNNTQPFLPEEENDDEEPASKRRRSQTGQVITETAAAAAAAAAGFVEKNEDNDEGNDEEEGADKDDENDDDDDDFEAAMTTKKRKAKKAKKASKKGAKSKEKEKIKLSYEDFQRYAHELTTYLRRKAIGDVSGIARSKVIEWYIEAHKDVIGDDRDKISAHAKLLKQILKRLLSDEQIITVPTDDASDPVLAVHPNFAPRNTAVMF